MSIANFSACSGRGTN